MVVAASDLGVAVAASDLGVAAAASDFGAAAAASNLGGASSLGGAAAALNLVVAAAASKSVVASPATNVGLAVPTSSGAQQFCRRLWRWRICRRQRVRVEAYLGGGRIGRLLRLAVAVQPFLALWLEHVVIVAGDIGGSEFGGQERWRWVYS